MTGSEKLKKIKALIARERVAILKAKTFIDTGVGSHAQKILIKLVEIAEA